MEEIRCGSCRRKLAEGEYTRLSIKCPRCGAFNQLSAESAPSERPLSVKQNLSSNDRRSIPDFHTAQR